MYIYSKFRRGWGFADTASDMTSMRCVRAAKNSPASQVNLDFDRFFCSGMQMELFELNPNPGAFGATIRTYDDGIYMSNICGQVSQVFFLCSKLLNFYAVPVC
ncbi:unnamed protein product [Hymenolepis diminuta]|uniref:ATP-grasp domain-containing protein n=1 Tax=Hymenolepis diminuta TaxID=6216 RepID=A0A0R3SEW9_HYMDI|nr:unnamed protein product [Hymenolepis diminuta]VUZ42989.1 unnamed protein product [Hymenolepis diminuta]